MKSLTQKINDDLVRIYEQRRNDAFRLRDERVSHLYRQYPYLESLDRLLKHAGLNQLLAVPEQEEKQVPDYSDAENERLAFLERQGIEDGYDRPSYVCRACGDTGRIDGDWC